MPSQVNDRTKARDLKAFQPYEMFPQGFTTILYGLRRCGKNVMWQYMMHEMYDRLKDMEVHLFSNTAVFNYDCQWYYLPRSSVHTDMTRMDEELGEIIGERRDWYENRFYKGSKKRRRRPAGASGSDGNAELDRRMSGRFGRKGEVGQSIEQDSKNIGGEEDESEDEEEDEEEAFPEMLLIFDDCVNENSIRHSQALNFCMIAGRHVRINLMITSQNFCGSGSVPPPIREQAEVIFIVANPASIKARKMIEEEYLTKSDSTAKGAGRRLMDECTSEAHRAFVICKTDNTARLLSEYCFYYGPVPYEPDKPCMCPRNCGQATRDCKRRRYGTQAQWEEDEKMDEQSATACDPRLKLYNPPDGRKRRRRGKMTRNTDRTVNMRASQESYVMAPSAKRQKMIGNIFGATGTYKPKN